MMNWNRYWLKLNEKAFHCKVNGPFQSLAKHQRVSCHRYYDNKYLSSSIRIGGNGRKGGAFQNCFQDVIPGWRTDGIIDHGPYCSYWIIETGYEKSLRKHHKALNFKLLNFLFGKDLKETPLVCKTKDKQYDSKVLLTIKSPLPTHKIAQDTHTQESCFVV
jgi:hypothetical protein